MTVLILGGYGVFGSKLAELLVRDGHDVIISGRDEKKLTALAARLSCRLLVVDHLQNPSAVFALKPHMVVDAAGPFQTYHGDPYAIPRLCLEHGADYLDLSDDAQFTQGITDLDELARAQNRRLLSSASSVPGISSAIAKELCKGLEEITLIDTAILPGNRAPRGASVIASIVSQLGTSLKVFRGGVWRDQACWSDSRIIELAPGIKRRTYFIEVPDIPLFPQFFAAKSVMFRAGMELPLLNAALCALSAIRKLWPFDVTPKRAELFRRMANLSLPFGTDVGGMRVLVVGRLGGDMVRREWRLLATGGEGP